MVVTSRDESETTCTEKVLWSSLSPLYVVLDSTLLQYPKLVQKARTFEIAARIFVSGAFDAALAVEHLGVTFHLGEPFATNELELSSYELERINLHLQALQSLKPPVRARTPQKPIVFALSDSWSGSDHQDQVAENTDFWRSLIPNLELRFVDSNGACAEGDARLPMLRVE